MDEAVRASLGDRLATLGESVEETGEGGLRVGVAPERALDVLRRLRDEPGCAMRRLVDLTVVDSDGVDPGGVDPGDARRGESTRFVAVYVLHAPEVNATVRVHVPIADPDPTLDSVVPLWPAAAWLEREAFDLFGIRFRGHPDLRRLLLPHDFEGAPLRKDHPLRDGPSIAGERAS